MSNPFRNDPDDAASYWGVSRDDRREQEARKRALEAARTRAAENARQPGAVNALKGPELRAPSEPANARPTTGSRSATQSVPSTVEWVPPPAPGQRPPEPSPEIAEKYLKSKWSYVLDAIRKRTPTEHIERDLNTSWGRLLVWISDDQSRVIALGLAYLDAAHSMANEAQGILETRRSPPVGLRYRARALRKDSYELGRVAARIVAKMRPRQRKWPHRKPQSHQLAKIFGTPAEVPPSYTDKSAPYDAPTAAVKGQEHDARARKIGSLSRSLARAYRKGLHVGDTEAYRVREMHSQLWPEVARAVLPARDRAKQREVSGQANKLGRPKKRRNSAE